MTLTITIKLLSISYGKTTLNHLEWWQQREHNDLVLEAMSDNERRIDACGEDLEPDKQYLLKFMLCNAVIRFQDPLLTVPLVVFFIENLPAALDSTKDRKRIVLDQSVRKNRALRTLLARIVGSRTDVDFADRMPSGHSPLLRYGFPVIALGFSIGETFLGMLSRLGKKQLRRKKIIFSNYRHQTASDETNIFWGNFVRALSPQRHDDVAIVYYNQLVPVQRGYYFRMFTDRSHRYLTEYLSFAGLLRDIGAYARMRVPHELHFFYNGVDYGDVLLPLVHAYYRILMPFLLKTQQALTAFQATKPTALFTDSELSLVGVQLGFLRTACLFVALSNEVVSETYAALPYRQGFARPQFTYKFVYGQAEKELLVRRYKYPTHRLLRFPDPRFLETYFNPLPTRNTTMLISVTVDSFYGFCRSFARQLKKSSLASKHPPVYKPHPLEEQFDKVAVLEKQMPIYREQKLAFVPTYAVTYSSTLGLELLMRGTIVFFIDKKIFGIGNYFGIAEQVPYLVCHTEGEVIAKMEELERSPTQRKRLAATIRTYLSGYGLDGLPQKMQHLRNLLKNS